MNIEWGKFYNPQLAWDNLPFILDGLSMTLSISLIGMASGLIIGLFLAMLRMSKWFFFRWPARIYISFMRGTPILVLLYIIYFGLPSIGIKLDAFTAACICFGFNSAAYIGEVQRASIQSIDTGQWESARALNIPYWKTLTRVILPQGVRTAVPPLSNIFMDMVKATSLAAVITIPEIFQKSQIVLGKTYDAMTSYITVAILYWIICLAISYLQEYLEKRYSKFI